jgi:hypothetical protein
MRQFPRAFPRPFPEPFPRGAAAGPAAPVFLDPISLSEAGVAVRLDQDCQVYILASDSPDQMTGPAIIAAVLAETPDAFGDFAFTHPGPATYSFDLSGLTPGTNYFHVAADAGGAISAAEPFGFEYDPDLVAPTISGTSVNPGETDAVLSWSTDEGNGTAFWLVDTNATRTFPQVEAGGGLDSGSAAVSASGAQTPITAEGLTAATGYYFHIGHRDAAGNESSVTSVSFTTDAAVTLGVVSSLGSFDATFNTSVGVTMPATVNAGNTLLVIVAFGADRTITVPSGWTAVDYIAASSNGGGTGVYKKTADGTEDGATVNWTASASVLAASVAYALDLPNGTIEVAKTNAARNPPSITPTGGSLERIFIATDACYGCLNTGAYTGAPSGYGGFIQAQTSASSSGSTGDRTIVAAHVIKTASTEDPDAFGVTGVPGTAAYQSFTIAAW